MKKLAKVLAMILALSMVLALAACGGNTAAQQAPAQNIAPAANEGGAAPAAPETPAISFTISTDAANRTQYCELFVKNLDEATNGRIKGEVLAANSLGNCNDMRQMLQLGTLDVMLSDDMSVDSNLNGALGFAWLPGLVANYEEADQYRGFYPSPRRSLGKRACGAAILFPHCSLTHFHKHFLRLHLPIRAALLYYLS